MPTVDVSLDADRKVDAPSERDQTSKCRSSLGAGARRNPETSGTNHGDFKKTICLLGSSRKVDARLPAKWNSNSHGARPVHQIITMIKWIRTSKLSAKNCLSWAQNKDETPKA